MHYCFQVAKSILAPAQIPAISNVDIAWVHTDADGNPDIAASITAAAQMVAGYGIVGDLFQVVPEITSQLRELKAAKQG